MISHFDTISNVLDKVCADYENLMLLSDFNVETEENMSEFMSMYSLKKLAKHKTCFRKPFLYRSGSNELPSKFSKK